MAHVRDLVCHDHVMFRVYCRLDVIAHYACAATTRSHGSGVWISQGDLSVRRLPEPLTHRPQFLHLRLHHLNLALQMFDARFGHRGRIAICTIQICKIPSDAFLELVQSGFQLAIREVLVSIVHCLELAAVDGNDRLGEQAQATAHNNEISADATDGLTVVLTEICNRFEIRGQPPREPNQLDVSLSLPLESAAGLDAVQVPVDVDLQKRRRMVSRSACCLGFRTVEVERLQIQLVDEHVDDPDWVVLCDVIVQTFWKQNALGSVLTFDESLHEMLASAGHSAHYMLPGGALAVEFTLNPQPRIDCSQFLGDDGLRRCSLTRKDEMRRRLAHPTSDLEMQPALSLLTFDVDNPPYISSLRFGAFALVLAPFGLWLALVCALEGGVLFPSQADEAWFVSSRRPLVQNDVALDDSTVLSLERTMCFGWCPDYTLRLHGSGRVEYVGRHFVCDFGERESAADTQEVRRLVEAMLTAGFIGLAWNPGALMTDHETVVTTLHHDGRTFRVSHYHGDPGAPRWLSFMEEEIDRVAGSARWLPITGEDWRLYCKSAEGQLRPVSMEGPEGQR